MSDERAGFLSRWSRRKTQTQTQTRQDAVAVEAALPRPAQHAPLVAGTATTAIAPAAPGPEGAVVDAATTAAQPALPAADPLPTLDDVALLTPDSSYARFVARDVPGSVRNAALKKLFTDPQFNVMDGLDIYVGDYGKPDPLPASWLRQMVQSKALGLFDNDEPAGAAVEANTDTAPEAPAHGDASDHPRSLQPALTTDTPDDENADLRLQPDDAARRKGTDAGADGDAGRQH